MPRNIKLILLDILEPEIVHNYAPIIKVYSPLNFDEPQ